MENDRLQEVLGLVLHSKNCRPALKRILDGVRALDEHINYLDYNDYEALFDEDIDELLDIVEEAFGIDISDACEQYRYTGSF